MKVREFLMIEYWFIN